MVSPQNIVAIQNSKFAASLTEAVASIQDESCQRIAVHLALEALGEKLIAKESGGQEAVDALVAFEAWKNR
jgi:hypothetical protein